MEITLETLKEILENLQTPEKLNGHAWAEGLFVRDAVSRHPHLAEKGHGERILFALAQQFRMLMPVSPPKQGVRLDPRWTEFGFLAARYFAPILFGRPAPETYQDACARMDESILLFVYGKPVSDLTREQIDTYRLIGDEFQSTPLSTLSDWNRKGLQRLADAINMHERHLSINGTPPSPATTESTLSAESTPGLRKKRWVWLTVLALFMALLLLGYLQARRVYDAALQVYADARNIQSAIKFPPSMQDLDKAGPQLITLQQDIKSLRAEVDDYLWLAPLLGWVPRYGCEIEAAPHFLDMTDALADASVKSYEASKPLLEALSAEGKNIAPEEIIKVLARQNLQFAQALQDVESAGNARNQLEADCLSPEIRENYLPKADLLLNSMNDALTLAIEMPHLVGAGAEGPKTYLILVQNEDELRPTGGFITAAGNLLLKDGKIVSLEFTNSGLLDDWSKPYPSAPWQLREYMNSPVLIFRDANWFTHYPDSALYAEYLYSYTNDHSVDGVIALDQRMLVILLHEIGPVIISDDSQTDTITSENVLEYLRRERINEGGVGVEKKFIGRIASAVLKKIFSGDADWPGLSTAILTALQEKHILVQFDNPAMNDLASRRNWDGAVMPGNGDFLMLVDSNIGFNKTSANITAQIEYRVNFTDLSAPESSLSISHTNSSNRLIPCIQWGGLEIESQRYYPIDRCYWDYLRVYTPAGTRLLFADPQNIPADWMIRRRPVNARTDVLDEEIEGAQAFGLLKVIPGGQTIITNFRFSLPASVISSDRSTDEMIYSLKIQKQPGTVAIPVSITLEFPQGTTFTAMPLDAVVNENIVTLQTDLREDRLFQVIFRSP